LPQRQAKFARISSSRFGTVGRFIHHFCTLPLKSTVNGAVYTDWHNIRLNFLHIHFQLGWAIRAMSALSSWRKPRLVMIGNGMAGARAVEDILAVALDLFAITMFGDEPYGNYNRILLSNILNGIQDEREIS
jgi:hypothetical protein